MGIGNDGERPFTNPEGSFFDILFNVFDKPVVWFRETIVEPNRKQYNWYHRVYRRVPTIDECTASDSVCKFEAEQQFKRDRQVESAILHVLKVRVEDCIHYERPDDVKKCQPLQDTYLEALDNWFIKYGDLGVVGGARDALAKQKHRMIWERRYGPVGTGMNRVGEN